MNQYFLHLFVLVPILSSELGYLICENTNILTNQSKKSTDGVNNGKGLRKNRVEQKHQKKIDHGKKLLENAFV